MIVPLLIILRSVAALHEEDDYRPVYTNVPGKGLVVVTPDFMTYVYVIFTSVPLFGLIVACHYLIRSRVDLYYNKKRDTRQPVIGAHDFRMRNDARPRAALYKPGYISKLNEDNNV
jgi:hypothetical protein